MKHILQRIVFPNKLVCDESEMYLRCNDKVQMHEDRVEFEKGGKCDFSTYFNALSLNKWTEYTGINNVRLVLRAKGKFLIEIYSASWFRESVRKSCCCTQEFFSDGSHEEEFDIPIASGDSIFFSLTCLDNTGIFFGGNYSTILEDTKKLNEVCIDVVMCTFKREPYVKRNINLLKENLFSGDKYKAAGHFRVIVIDNGRTLKKDEIESGDGLIKLYPNINTGGSGGFTRGLIESLKEGKASHVLFMDDDVLVQIEAFVRTYNLLSILKENYRSAFLGGAMLRLDRKNIQHANIEGYNGFDKIVFLREGLNLSDYRDVLFNEKYQRVSRPYCGWWYCCMPVALLGLDNLPYPFFVRGDDIEFSLRIAKECISLNGISVWHEAFDLKTSSLMDVYFWNRNQLVVNNLHNDLRYRDVAKIAGKFFFRNIFRYDYGGAGLSLDAVERFLQGPEFFKNVDTCKDLSSHGLKQVKLKPLENIDWESDKAYRVFMMALSGGRGTLFKKILRYVTLNGHFLPDFCFKSIGYSEYGANSNSNHFFLRRRVLACNLNFDSGAIFEIDRRKCIELVIRYIKLNIQLIKRFESVKCAYKQEFPYMTSQKFWITYLKLDNRSTEN